MKTAIKISIKDHVATATTEINITESVLITGVEGDEIVKVQKVIPMGHKIALEPISKGENLVKYGEVIGTATKDIQRGDRVHVHNS